MIDLFQPGAYWRTAGGNTENASDQAPVIRWSAWSINPDNGMNGDPRAWDLSRQRWAAAGIAHFPWLHCRSLADVERLVGVGKAYSSPAIGLNIEDVFTDFINKGISLQDVAQKLAGWEGPVHMATLPWVQNGAGWGVLKRCLAALEIMPDEQQNLFPSGYNPAIPPQCVSHAFEEGLVQVTYMFKTKGYTPAQYGQPWDICHSLYTGDDITPSAAGWDVWQALLPCIKQINVPEEQIGPQDGITGYMKWLKTQPGVPPPGPLYDPANISTWPWPDKLERTLRLLKKEHDG